MASLESFCIVAILAITYVLIVVLHAVSHLLQEAHEYKKNTNILFVTDEIKAKK